MTLLHSKPAHDRRRLAPGTGSASEESVPLPAVRPSTGSCSSSGRARPNLAGAPRPGMEPARGAAGFASARAARVRAAETTYRRDAQPALAHAQPTNPDRT